jgi:transposase InsO family protein
MAALCRRFGISRKTGYKWLGRFAEEGELGLLERSRAPASHPNATPEDLEAALVRLRGEKQRGPKKLVVALAKEFPGRPLPSTSTVGDILKRNGLVAPRKKRRRCTPSESPLAHADAANRVWCADFKGWFLTGNGRRVDPLTVTDAHTRFLLGCQCMCGKTDTEHVKALFSTWFRQFGLPERIRTDNGAPFASTGLAGLSRLSVWWIRLGIEPERIRPATPSENGRHERFHRTLKEHTLEPAAQTPRLQQKRFDAFRDEYNHDRPHEALGQVPPGTLYTPSPRVYPARLPPLKYHDDMVTRRVRGGGQMQWCGRDVMVSNALCGETVGLKALEGGRWAVYFCQWRIGTFYERALKVAGQTMHKEG